MTVFRGALFTSPVVLAAVGYLVRRSRRSSRPKLPRQVRPALHAALTTITKLAVVVTICPLIHLAQRVQPTQAVALGKLEQGFLARLGLSAGSRHHPPPGALGEPAGATHVSQAQPRRRQRLQRSP